MSSSQGADKSPPAAEKERDDGVIDTDVLTVKDILDAKIFGGNVKYAKPNIAKKTGHSVKPLAKGSTGKIKPLKTSKKFASPEKPVPEKPTPKVSEPSPSESKPALSKKGTKTKHKKPLSPKSLGSVDESKDDKETLTPEEVKVDATEEVVQEVPEATTVEPDVKEPENAPEDPTEAPLGDEPSTPQEKVEDVEQDKDVGDEKPSADTISPHLADDISLRIVDNSQVAKNSFDAIPPLPEAEKKSSFLGGITAWLYKTFKARKSSSPSSDVSFSYPNVYRDEKNRKTKSTLLDPVPLPRQSRVMQLDDLENARSTEEGRDIETLVAKTAAKKVSKGHKGSRVQKKYTLCIGTSYALVAVFLLELIFNKISFNGRCISKVLYPSARENPQKLPYIVEHGYGACEYNLQTKAAERLFFGSNASDGGWPEALIDNSLNYPSDAAWDSPNPRIFHSLGALNTNYVRNYGEGFRVFWGIFLHGGFVHLIFNLCSQIMLLSILEPDWGFWRSFVLFFISGISGNLMAAVLSPSIVTIGSSGCLFGLIGSLIPFCLENWAFLAHSSGIFLISIVLSILGLALINGETISFYAHMGGWLGGFLWGFSTLKTDFILKETPAFDGILLSPLLSWTLDNQKRLKVKTRMDGKVKTAILKRRRQLHGKTKTLKENIQSVAVLKGKPLDILLRVLPFIALIVMIAVLHAYLYNEGLYSTMFKPSPDSTGPQCCYLKSLIDGKKAYWCFGSYESATHYCEL